MRLDLRFTRRPVEDLWCQAIVALVFQDGDIISGAVSRLNDKMAGALSNLARKKLWSGARDEKTLLAGENMIKADKLLLYGLGKDSDFDTESLEGCINRLALCLDKMGINDFGLHLPAVKGFESRYPQELEIASKGLVALFLESHELKTDFLLKIVFSVDDGMTIILPQVEARLREYFINVLDFSIIIDRNSAIIRPDKAENEP